MRIETFNCYGEPITISLRGKRSPLYKDNDNRDDFFSTPFSKKELLEMADECRRLPLLYVNQHNRIAAENASEWAFVIEQLVAEGTL